jgi:hypothetical protein
MKSQKIGKSTKGRDALQPFRERVITWLVENYEPPQAALDPEQYKRWRDTISPTGECDHYLEYLNADRGALKSKPRRTRYVPGPFCVAQTCGGLGGSRDAEGDMGSAIRTATLTFGNVPGWRSTMPDDLKTQIEKAVKGKSRFQKDLGKRFLAVMKKYKVEMNDPVQKNAVNAVNEFWVETLKENGLVQSGTWT